MVPQWITIHNTDNTSGTAESHSRYIINGSGGRQASWHYTVDDKAIYQHLRDNEQGWHAGDSNGPGNTTSIGVEVCMYTGMNKEICWRNAAWLAATLMVRHKLGIDRVVPHKKWSGKQCPSQLLPHWNSFIDMVKQEFGKLQKAQPKPPQASGTNIIGRASATLERAKAWAKSKNAPSEFVALADLYWELAPARGGIDPAIAYVQFGHETGYLYRDGRSSAGIDVSYHNPCGLKITAGGGDTQASAHKRFKDWKEGITAHLDHLALYGGASGYPKKETPDPRHFPYLHGTAKTLEQLGAKWAPSSSYGTNLVGELSKLRGAVVDKPATSKPSANVATVELNGKVIATGEFINGLVTVLVRDIADALGAKLVWDNDTKTATVNGKKIVGVQVVNGRATAPVREVTEAAGYRVTGWDGIQLRVTIQKEVTGVILKIIHFYLFIYKYTLLG
ncbi:N-acetylmuramoyl-L-alanine amidase [Paenibacillus popilliae]|uniref:N-acetylmuramoyl-L-alanine amidase n=1 Tax=Paenibacillus popilliae TaxID=78057 RepID=A0ABY3AKV7_PAEPP|nr:N-acetylmuramoyl-L-alanine amidase [Paenibacillus sp. SDF0028]TQR43383.1 hypothetical protein C7Y44_19695 [Paenibacillus sp. SDF0028]